MDVHLGGFCVLAVVNSASVSIGVCVFFSNWSFSLDVCPGVQLQDDMVALFLFF